MYTFFKPNLVIVDLNLIQTLLTKNFVNFHDHGMYCNKKIDSLSDCLVLLSGKMAKSNQINAYFHVEKNKTNVPYLEGVYSTDIIMFAVFGIKFNYINEPNSEFRIWGKKFFEENSFWIALCIFAPQILDFFSIPFTNRQLKYRHAHKIIRYDFMNLLMEGGYVEPDDDKKINIQCKYTLYLL
ncbi:hypothetical protein P5V15_004796 [Pogonomyrmex californicus]